MSEKIEPADSSQNYSDQDIKNLEAKKLEAEIEGLKEQHLTERIKEKYSYRKFLLGTILIALLSLAVNIYLAVFNSSREVKLESLKDCFSIRQRVYETGRENVNPEMIDQLIDCFPDDEDAYIAMKEAIELDEVSEEEEKDIENTMLALVDDGEDGQGAEIREFYELKEKQDLDELLPEEKTKILALSGNPEITKAVEQIDLNVSEELKLVEMNKTLAVQKEKNYGDLLDDRILKSKKTRELSDTISWVKPNFYRDHEEIRILLNKLNETSAYGNICIENDDNTIDTLNFDIRLGTTFEFKSADYSYELAFKESGKAGYNPFDRAMYYSLRKLRALKGG